MAAQRKKTLWRMVTVIFPILLIIGAVAAHYRFDPWGFYRKVNAEEAALRMEVVRTAQGWLGTNEADGSHKKVIDLYNAHEPLAVGYTVQYTDSWCSVFVSTVAIQNGLTDIIPTECGCQRHIALFESLSQWEERDDWIPLPGDLIFYDWEETEAGDATGWSDHVGIVVGTKWPFVRVIEGNCDDQVMERTILLNNRTIRGFGLPDYTAAAE